MNLRSLKLLVAAMGVLLVAGVVVLAVAIATRLSHRVPLRQKGPFRCHARLLDVSTF